MGKQHWMRFALVLLTLAGLLSALPLAYAQEVTANVVGTITDPSGAPVSGATVTATDNARGVTYSSKTNEVGAYTISRLPVSNYTVKASASGFQTAVYPTFTLVLNQTARVDMQMKVGQVTETVEVTGAAPVLETQTTQVSTVIDSVSADRLPLATRNYVQLTMLSPGAASPDPTNFNNGDNVANGARPYINGNREQSNNFLLDGLDNNQVSDNLLGYTPAPDAIQEFNLITNNASAQFGNFQGGIVSTTIKSGTNNFHGDLWEYFRNDKLNANSWANNFGGVKRSPLRWNMYGGTVGGPVIKNKLFFFFDYQGQRFDHPASTSFFTVFTNPERQGNFGSLCTSGFDASGICNDRAPDPNAANPPSKCASGVNTAGCLVANQLYNPCGSVTNAPCSAANFVPGVRVPFRNNIIPVAMINPVAQALFNSSFYPQPANNNVQNNAFNTVTQAFDNYQYDIKGDWNATEKDHIFGRFSHAHQSNPSTNSVQIIGQGFSNAPINNEVADWSHTFSPSLLNDFRVGVNYVKLNNCGNCFNGSPVGNLATNLGIANGNPIGPGLMFINFYGGTPSQFGNGTINGIGAIGTEQNFRSAVIQFTDNVMLTHGHHVINMGFDFHRNRINAYYAGNSGKYGGILFSGQYTSLDGNNTDPSTGAGPADFFLGMPDANGVGIPKGFWGQRQSVIAGYVQDDWRVTETLTLNLGLRYQAFTPWVERNNRQINSTLFGGQLIAPNCAALGSIPFSCQNSDPGLYQGTYGLPDFQPRLGFAWTPGALGGKTVVRGAFTISSYMEGTGTNLRLPINPPATPSETLNSYNGTQFPALTQEGILPPTPGDPFHNALFRMWDPHVQPANTDQWNLTIQQQFNNTTTFQIGYVGQHGTHLMVPMPYLQKQLLPNSACAKPPCTAPSLYLSGNPALQSDLAQISGTASVGSMSYNALQAVLQKRYSSGLQYQVAYTYSKCMTDNSGYYGTWGDTQSTPANPYYQNLYNPHADWAPCYFDQTHALTAYANYELPFGHGKKFLNSAPGVVNQIAGGWSLNPIVNIHTGYPLALYNFGSDPTGTGSRGLRPNCNGQNHVFGRKPAFDTTTGAFTGYQWFDPSAYSPSGVGQFGNCPAQGPIRGPGYADVDFSFQKDFPIKEAMRLQFRADFINAFNHVNLNAPQTDVTSGNMGLINSSQDPRNIQLALKFYF